MATKNKKKRQKDIIAWKEFEKELIAKYGENYRSKWTPTEFKKFMKLNHEKLPGMSTGAYAHTSNKIATRRESGVYRVHK